VLIPLWIILVSRVRLGAWSAVPDEALNGAWKPREAPETPQVLSPPALTPTSISAATLRTLPILGLAGLVVWLFASSFRTDAPPITISRSEAEKQARQALADKGVELDSSWKLLSHVEGQPGEINRFVWQTAGRDRYQKLLGVYVTPPSWVVRFARFQGDVAERAEEYQV
jgi:hypothetical protein